MLDLFCSIIYFAVLGGLALLLVALLVLAVKVLVSRWSVLSLIGKLHHISTLVWLFGMLNLCLGMGIVETVVLGGTAMGGKVEQGQYYLFRKPGYTKVSEPVYKFCLSYERVVVSVSVGSFLAALITSALQGRANKSMSNLLKPKPNSDDEEGKEPFTPASKGGD